ncbi:alpha/beta-hydrolase [Xylariaceae sp. FL1272]|nr:alpha/beta-hydrolase [Xylariaceae sp. FL1272]
MLKAMPFSISSLLGIRRPMASTPTALPGFLLVIAACVSLGLIYRPAKARKELFTPSPRKSAIAVSKEEIQSLPYPPDSLPVGRDVETPYGSVHVYEWGPEDGERVLFVHGISTPVIALGDLGHEMVAKGYRVMMFDLFGRGYSDAPNDLPYDSRLYVTQLLLVLASSKLPWCSGFNLVGYSLGGGLSVAFTRYFPHLVRSLVLIAPCGLIRAHHVGWRSWLFYNSRLLPEFLVRRLVKRRIRPEVDSAYAVSESGAGATDIILAEAGGKLTVKGDGDANGGAGFNSATISKTRPRTTVSSVVAWQVDNHQGFVDAFMSTIRQAPIYAPQEDWTKLATILEDRRSNSSGTHNLHGLQSGRILMVLGEDDGVIVRDETVQDAVAVLGSNGVEFAVLAGGHELPITNSEGVAEVIDTFLL